MLVYLLLYFVADHNDYDHVFWYHGDHNDNNKNQNQCIVSIGSFSLL